MVAAGRRIRFLTRRLNPPKRPCSTPSFPRRQESRIAQQRHLRENKPEQQPTNPLSPLHPVIPAKAGIQKRPTKPATRKQARTSTNKSPLAAPTRHSREGGNPELPNQDSHPEPSPNSSQQILSHRSNPSFPRKREFNQASHAKTIPNINQQILSRHSTPSFPRRRESRITQPR